MSTDAPLEQRIAATFGARGVQFKTKKMMGGLAFMVDGKMCVGTVKQLLMVRFDPDLHEEVLARPGAGPMDFTGRPMRGFVFVKSDAVQTVAALASWLDLALAFNPRARRSAKKKPKPSVDRSRGFDSLKRRSKRKPPQET